MPKSALLIVFLHFTNVYASVQPEAVPWDTLPYRKTNASYHLAKAKVYAGNAGHATKESIARAVVYPVAGAVGIAVSPVQTVKELRKAFRGEPHEAGTRFAMTAVQPVIGAVTGPSKAMYHGVRAAKHLAKAACQLCLFAKEKATGNGTRRPAHARMAMEESNARKLARFKVDSKLKRVKYAKSAVNMTKSLTGLGRHNDDQQQ